MQGPKRHCWLLLKKHTWILTSVSEGQYWSVVRYEYVCDSCLATKTKTVSRDAYKFDINRTKKEND